MTQAITAAAGSSSVIDKMAANKENLQARQQEARAHNDNKPQAAAQQPAATANTKAAEGAKAAEGTKAVQKTDLPNADDLKAAQNKRLLETTMQVSIDSGNQSLALLLKTAIEGVNKALEPQLGKNAIQNAVDSGVDTSPEATAGRILALSTAFFDAYAKQNPGKSGEELVKDFTATIRSGFERGFGEASKVLEGLNVLNGDIKKGIEDTYARVQAGYDDFIKTKTAELAKAEQDKTAAKEAQSAAPGVGQQAAERSEAAGVSRA